MGKIEHCGFEPCPYRVGDYCFNSGERVEDMRFNMNRRCLVADRGMQKMPLNNKLMQPGGWRTKNGWTGGYKSK